VSSKLKVPAALRRTLRALHRDAGYVAVGLTFVYALSGLAVNHVADWDPNFTQVRQSYALPAFAPRDVEPEDAARLRVLGGQIQAALGIKGHLDDAYASSRTELDLTLDTGTLHANLTERSLTFEGQKPRFLLRAANFLHTNRGKKAWTLVADAYAAILLYLATSGLFLLPVQRGLKDRKLWLVLGGALVPIVYVTVSHAP
jgi:uncharacterized protein